MTHKLAIDATATKPGGYPLPVSQKRSNGQPQSEYVKSTTKALIVDDCVSTRLLLEHYLQLRDFKTWSAPSGEAALEMAARLSFDLVFMDISLPGIDGLEAIRRMTKLKTIPSQTQFIICSGYTPIDLGLEQIDHAFLHKPICRQTFSYLMDRLENSPPLQAPDQFDNTILTNIFEEADDRLKHRICTELCNDITCHVNNMLAASKQRNLAKIERATHALKGISGTFGAVSLHNLAREGNQMARNIRSDEALKMVTRIETSALLALDTIQRIFRAQKPNTNTNSRAQI